VDGLYGALALTASILVDTLGGEWGREEENPFKA